MSEKKDKHPQTIIILYQNIINYILYSRRLSCRIMSSSVKLLDRIHNNSPSHIFLEKRSRYRFQAALGPAVLEVATSQHQDVEYSKTIVMVCIISILLTAPAGAIIVSLSGPKLLTKAKPSNEQWRRGPRPSIRDITLNSEDEDNGTSVSNDQAQECDGVKADCTAEVQSEKI